MVTVAWKKGSRSIYMARRLDRLSDSGRYDAHQNGKLSADVMSYNSYAGCMGYIRSAVYGASREDNSKANCPQ
jgi:hypothetical protein